MRLTLNISNPFARKQSKNLAATTEKEKPKKKLPWKPKSVYSTRQDVKLWKQAEALYNNAEDPRNFAIQLIFDDIANDALLTSQIQNRKQQIFSIDIALKKLNGEIDEEQTHALKKMPLYRFLTHQKLDAIYYGASLVELSYSTLVNGNTVLIGEKIPRTNFVPQTGTFYQDYGDDVSKIFYRNLPEFGVWILEYNSKEIGLLNKAIPHVLFKRFAQSCWSELCEIYGIPPRVMKTNTQDPQSLARAEQMMSDMGAAAWFIIDDQESFEFAQGVATNGDVYNNLITLCSNELCLLICGAIIAQDTKNGSRSKDEAAQEMLWLLVQSDMAMLEEQWNNITIPALQKHGIIKGDLTFEFEPTEDISQLWTMVKEAMQSGAIFKPEWLNEKFGLEIEGFKDIAAKGDKTDKETLQAIVKVLLGLKGKIKEDLDLSGFFD